MTSPDLVMIDITANLLLSQLSTNKASHANMFTIEPWRNYQNLMFVLWSSPKKNPHGDQLQVPEQQQQNNRIIHAFLTSSHVEGAHCCSPSFSTFIHVVVVPYTSGQRKFLTPVTPLKKPKWESVYIDPYHAFWVVHFCRHLQTLWKSDLGFQKDEFGK